MAFMVIHGHKNANRVAKNDRIVFHCIFAAIGRGFHLFNASCVVIISV